MNNENYSEYLEKFLSDESECIKNGGEKKKLLLHACCAPCSSYCLIKLKDIFDITLYFYNPNITDSAEYDLRLNELIRFSKNFNILVVDGKYNKQEYLSAVLGLENEKEGGTRCEKCFKLRLYSTAKYAKENGFDLFCSTLSISPLKNAKKINDIGVLVENELGVKYLKNDFKKKGGYLKSIELSREYGLYRQNYCGCEFSKREK